MNAGKWGSAAVLAAVAGCAAVPPGESGLRRENAALRAQLQQARELARENRLGCAALARERELALANARQLRADTQYLASSTAKLSDAVTRLSYDDWNRWCRKCNCTSATSRARPTTSTRASAAS